MRIDRTAFRQGVSDAFTLAPLRWWLFKRLSDFGWWICPEPHKSRLQNIMPRWDGLPDDFAFASRHNDETGECEPVDLDPPMVRKLRERVASKSAEETKAKIREAFSGLSIPAKLKSDDERQAEEMKRILDDQARHNHLRPADRRKP